jgi:hypothetical protein
MPQSDPPTFRREDAQSIRHVANLTERDFAMKYGASAPGDGPQRLRDITDRVEAECDTGVPGDFTKDDVAQLETLASNLRSGNSGIDPNKLTPEEVANFKGREAAAAATERITATIAARLPRGAR